MRLDAKAVPTELDAALPRLRRYAWVLTGALREADELVVDTLEQAQRPERRQVPGESLRTELFALMHERHVIQRSSSGAEPVAAKPDVEPAAASQPSRLLEHFGDLPVEEREVLLLVAVEQMAYADIATVLGVPPATVIARLKRARERVRAADSPRAGEGSTL
jgi:RNA polymerase sigma-70 factor (ECF subfamily)